MRQEDVDMINKTFPKWKESTGQVNTVGILSPCARELEIINKIFPDVWITELNEKDWDLFSPGQDEYDLLIACNVFMYSKDPAIWFKHVFAKCKYFWMQDLIRSWRSDECECACGPNGDRDVMRFTYPPNYLARVNHAFDLRLLSDRIINFIPYQTPGRPGKDALSFLLCLKGDL